MSKTMIAEGNLTRDPESIETKTGKSMARAIVAVNDQQYDQSRQEWVTTGTTYYTVIAFGSLAENLLTIVTKGQSIVFSGRESVRTFIRSDGAKGYDREVIVDYLGVNLRYRTDCQTRVDSPLDGKE